MKQISLLLIGLMFAMLSKGQTVKIRADDFANKTKNKSAIDTIQEEYLTIVFTGFFINTQKAYISINGEQFDTITVNSTGNYNFNEAIKIMKRFNELGWRLQNSNLSFRGEDSDYLFILMTRSTNINDKKTD